MTRGLVPAVDATTAGAPDVVASQGQRTGASAKRRKTSKTAAQATVAAGGRGTTAAGVVARAAALRVTGFYSDLLYQPWFCAHVDIAPEWLEVDNIDR